MKGKKITAKSIFSALIIVSITLSGSVYLNSPTLTSLSNLGNDQKGLESQSDYSGTFSVPVEINETQKAEFKEEYTMDHGGDIPIAFDPLWTSEKFEVDTENIWDAQPILYTLQDKSDINNTFWLLGNYLQEGYLPQEIGIPKTFDTNSKIYSIDFMMQFSSDSVINKLYHARNTTIEIRSDNGGVPINNVNIASFPLNSCEIISYPENNSLIGKSLDYAISVDDGSGLGSMDTYFIARSYFNIPLSAETYWLMINGTKNIGIANRLLIYFFNDGSNDYSYANSSNRLNYDIDNTLRFSSDYDMYCRVNYSRQYTNPEDVELKIELISVGSDNEVSIVKQSTSPTTLDITSSPLVYLNATSIGYLKKTRSSLSTNYTINGDTSTFSGLISVTVNQTNTNVNRTLSKNMTITFPTGWNLATLKCDEIASPIYTGQTWKISDTNSLIQVNFSINATNVLSTVKVPEFASRGSLIRVNITGTGTGSYMSTKLYRNGILSSSINNSIAIQDTNIPIGSGIPVGTGYTIRCYFENTIGQVGYIESESFIITDFGVVIVNLTDSLGRGIPNYEIVINSETEITDANGFATFDVVEYGTYFINSTEEIHVNSASMQYNWQLDTQYIFTIGITCRVKDKNGANLICNITIDGQTIQTTNLGAYFSLPEGEHSTEIYIGDELIYETDIEVIKDGEDYFTFNTNYEIPDVPDTPPRTILGIPEGIFYFILALVSSTLLLGIAYKKVNKKKKENYI